MSSDFVLPNLQRRLTVIFLTQDKDRIRNAITRQEIGVTPIVKKMYSIVLVGCVEKTRRTVEASIKRELFNWRIVY